MKIIAYFRLPDFWPCRNGTRYLQPALAGLMIGVRGSLDSANDGERDIHTSIRLCTINSHGKFSRFSDSRRF